jgi:hypothetical protein
MDVSSCFGPSSLRAQLNEAEFSPLLAAMLLYLHSKGVEAPLMSTISVASQFIYFWGRALSGRKFPWTPLGAAPRYVACVGLIYTIYKTL